jgi:FixJ family two-component response regulator
VKIPIGVGLARPIVPIQVIIFGFEVVARMAYEPSSCSAVATVKGALLSCAVHKTVVHLVEDDPALRATLTRLIESGGYAVKQYCSGADLLGSADSIDEGCILLDINMPEPDGFAVQRALISKGIRTPVILMTGSGDLTLLALKAGAADFMQKPFDRGELLSVLDDIALRVASL